jgi:hypothetical protein
MKLLAILFAVCLFVGNVRVAVVGRRPAHEQM